MATGQKRKKHDADGSPDKSEQVLNISLDVCGKCNKKCSPKSESIRCNLCSVWVHASCENLTRDEYKGIKLLSKLDNLVYYCHAHDCYNRIKNIIHGWIETHGTSQIEKMVGSLTKQCLSSEHDALKKVVSDLSSRIDKLQAQELELTSQIKDTSKALETYPDAIKSQNTNRKSNVVVYGVEECPPNTPRSARLQKDTNVVAGVFGGIDVVIEPTRIVDCYRLGKFKSQQTRPRPILVKLQRVIDASTILANKTSLSAPIYIKPDMSPAEQAIESKLLKERWVLIQGGYNRKSIKINSSNSSLYVNNQLFGKVENSQFQRSNNYKPNPVVTVNTDSSQTMEHDNTSTNTQSMDRQPPPPVETQQSS